MFPFWSGKAHPAREEGSGKMRAEAEETWPLAQIAQGRQTFPEFKEYLPSATPDLWSASGLELPG
jgi:hypothetical protein